MSRPSKGGKLHGCAPDASSVALLLIDVVNDLEFKGGEKLLLHAIGAARRIAKLKAAATRQGIPTIYVNDNFGRWRSDFRSQVDHCLAGEKRGSELVRMLMPVESDYFVLKPKHSGFHCTCLEILLKHMGVRTLILTGFAGNLCVLYTANDAYMRDFRLVVPRDCVASETRELNDYALSQMKQCLKADTTPSTRLARLNRL